MIPSQEKKGLKVMQRTCQACRKQYTPATLSGGGLSKTYKTCPYCGSANTAVTAGKMTNIPQLGKSRPPTSAGFNFNNKKPPTH